MDAGPIPFSGGKSRLSFDNIPALGIYTQILVASPTDRPARSATLLSANCDQRFFRSRCTGVTAASFAIAANPSPHRTLRKCAGLLTTHVLGNSMPDEIFY